MNCGICHNERTDDEIVCNFGICDECFDKDYTEYIESVAGPFDWIAA